MQLILVTMYTQLNPVLLNAEKLMLRKQKTFAKYVI